MGRLGKGYLKQAEDQETRIGKYEDVFAGNEEVKVGVFGEGWVFEEGI